MGALAADCSAPSKPIRAKAIPPAVMALRIERVDPAPLCTKKPPAALKLWIWKPAMTSATAVSEGMASLNTVITELALVNRRMPRRFRVTKTPMSKMAADEPRGAEGCIAGVVEAVGPGVCRQVLDGGEHLDRGDRRSLNVSEPTERRPGQTPKGMMHEPTRSSALREHRAEFRVHESQGCHEERGDHPADQSCGPGDGESHERAEKPARPKGCPRRDPEKTEEADLSPKALVGPALHYRPIRPGESRPIAKPAPLFLDGPQMAGRSKYHPCGYGGPVSRHW